MKSVHYTESPLLYRKKNRHFFQIFDKGIWYLRTESFKFMSLSQMTKAFRNGNGCSLYIGWNVNLTALLACTFEQKDNKTGPLAVIQQWLITIYTTHHKTSVTNLLMFCKDFFIKRRMILWNTETEKCNLYFCALPIVILRRHEHSRLECPLYKFAEIRNSTLIIHEEFSLLLH